MRCILCDKVIGLTKSLSIWALISREVDKVRVCDDKINTDCLEALGELEKREVGGRMVYVITEADRNV